MPITIVPRTPGFVKGVINLRGKVIKVGNLIREIAAASQEQDQGIGQVNNAAPEMDKVTQQNAANAEESASVAEEMNAQAEQMKGHVKELVVLIGGGKTRGGVGQGETLPKNKMGRREIPIFDSDPGKGGKKVPRSQ